MGLHRLRSPTHSFQPSACSRCSVSLSCCPSGTWGFNYLLFVIYFLSVVGMSFVPFDNAKIECFSRPGKFPATISPQLLRPALPSATDALHRPPSCRIELRGFIDLANLLPQNLEIPKIRLLLHLPAGTQVSHLRLSQANWYAGVPPAAAASETLAYPVWIKKIDL